MKHLKALTPEQTAQIKRDLLIYNKNLKFLEEIGVPHFHGEFSVNELAELLGDEKWLRTTLVKIKNKALW